MNGKALHWAVRVVAVLVLALGTGVLAQAPVPEHLKGIINDYTPATFVVAGVPKTLGPWEVRGVWSLKVDEDSDTADFSAALTMEHSDQGVISAGGGNFDNTVASRHAHTHHITVHGAVTHPDPMHPDSFRVKGPATISGNGNTPAPTDFGPMTTLQIDITGGTIVRFSNIAITFIGDAASHFGNNPIHGVVTKSQGDDDSGD